MSDLSDVKAVTTVQRLPRAMLSRRRTGDSLPETLARDISAYIVDRQLPEGTRLPPEREMRESLGIGKGTLREALRLLQNRGVITMRSGRHGGPVVRRPRSHDLGDAMGLVLAFESTTVKDVMNARVALEPVIARLAASRITRRQIAALEKTIVAMRSGAGDHETFLAQNVLFYETIAEASGNPALKVVNDMLKVVIDGSVIGATFPGDIHLKTAGAHEKILEALRARDADGSEQVVREHLETASRYWMRNFRALMNRPVDGGRSNGSG